MNTSSFQSLSDFALLHVTGTDSERFLQGQTTCDVVALAPNHWILGACCNAKGRMVANFVIAKTDDGFWLRLPRAQVEALKTHLSRYIVFFKATMHSHLDNRVWGNTTELNADPVLITQPLAAINEEQSLILNWPDGRQECWYFNEPSQNESAATTQLAWHAADIRQGLVWVTETSQLHWLPQEIDWPQQGGVSFSKGCYTGQEIVARLQFLGKSKKQLVRIESNESFAVPILNKLTNSDNQEVGELAAWQQQQGLAILNSNLQQQALQLANHNISWQPMFYQAATSTSGIKDD